MSNELAVVKKETVDIVAQKVKEYMNKGELIIPPVYSPENALKAAWLTLQNVKTKDKKSLAIHACSRTSVQNALFNMVVNGLNPVKEQCYFMPYGDQLTCQPSYFGLIYMAKQQAEVKEIYPVIIYNGDKIEFTLTNAQKKITLHEQKFENIKPDNIAGAYCVIEFKDGKPPYTEIMTWEEIQTSWRQSPMNINADGSTHKTFPSEMAIRTIISRATKRFIKSSNDNHLFREALNRSAIAREDYEAQQEIAAEANSVVIDIPGPSSDENQAPQEGQKETPGSAPSKGKALFEEENKKPAEVGPGF